MKHKEEDIPSPPKRSNLWIIPLVIFIAIIIFLCYINFTQVPYTATEEYDVQEQYTYQEAYYEKVPYTTQQCHYENLLYKIEYYNVYESCIQYECASYNSYCTQKNFWGNCISYGQSCASNKCVKYTKYCGIKIKNNDNKAATFDLKLYKYDYDDREKSYVTSDSRWVNGMDEGYMYWSFSYTDLESVGCTYSIESTPQKQVCDNVIAYRDEKKFRDKVGYKTVTKTRSVTKYTSVLKLWTNNVQWYYEVQE